MQRPKPERRPFFSLAALLFQKRRQPVHHAQQLDQMPSWAQDVQQDLTTASITVGARGMIDEMLDDYLTVTGREESCWPTRAYWRDMATHMGESRRRRLALTRLWPEYARFRQGRRSPGCVEVRKILLSGGRPRGFDCLHAAQCEHCRMFTLYLAH